MHFFERLRVKLELTALYSIDYEEFITACHAAFTKFDEQYPALPEIGIRGVLRTLPVDISSQNLLPQDMKHITPLQCMGDGNCLYR